MKPIFSLITNIFCFFPLVADCQKNKPRIPSTNGIIRIVFHNLVNDHPLVLHDSTYINPWGEDFVLSKCKYYIAQTTIYSKGKKITERNGYHLINQADKASLNFNFAVPANNYDSIGFLIGVDSARNTSGAQTGALDPLHDMFWTWNTGYIMEKLEGTSSKSSLVNNKFEYHIGGFRGENSALKYITLSFPPGNSLKIKKAKTSTVVIHADIGQFWQGNTQIEISNIPVCSTPGLLASQIAGNFSRIFQVAAISNSE